MGHVKPRYWCGACGRSFKTMFELQWHSHERTTKKVVKPHVKKQTLKPHSYFCLKCKMKHEEGVVSYVKHMQFKRAAGRPRKK